MSRILVVLTGWPWPLRSGDGRRALAVVDALVAEGHDLELLCLVESLTVADRDPSDRAITVIPFPRRELGPLARVRWLAFGGPPLALLARDRGPAIRETGVHLARVAPDLVWCHRLDAWWALSALLADHEVVVDTVDLESRKERSRLRAVAGRGSSSRGAVRSVLARIQGRRTIGAWSALEVDASKHATVAVCSTDEVASLPGAVVIPNTYRTPAVPQGGRPAAHPPTLLMMGLLTYPPNTDGACWLVEEVLPLLRALVPDVRLRLVGRAGPDVERLHDPPLVDVVGFAPDLEAELRRADVAVVPVRFGGGTRIKVLEAWAHGIPVVTTTMGVEGLGARSERDVLLGDDPAAFARSCARALTDPAVRSTLIDAGRAHHQDEFTDASLRRAVAEALGASTAQRLDRNP